jgi:D-Tyr-tRNAtyr deacylase
VRAFLERVARAEVRVKGNVTGRICRGLVRSMDVEPVDDGPVIGWLER